MCGSPWPRFIRPGIGAAPVMETMVFIDAFVQLHEGGRKNLDLSEIFAPTPRSLDGCVHPSSQALFSTSRCPLLFIIRIHSALTEILIFDMKTSRRNAKMGSTCAVVEMLSSFNTANVCSLGVGGRGKPAGSHLAAGLQARTRPSLTPAQQIWRFVLSPRKISEYANLSL